ncbi:MAG: DUF3575 domain-containing protein [Butyricimonas faecihominis]
MRAVYGYSWILSKHWNFEAEIGSGMFIRYDVTLVLHVVRA